jgi:Uma2 family endonuclease
MHPNTPTSPRSATMNVDEFMAFLETRSEKRRWDLIEGIATRMAPSSYAHRRIASNLAQLLNTVFSARELDLFAYNGTCVQSPDVRNFQPQPDVVVVPASPVTISTLSDFNWSPRFCRPRTDVRRST